MFLQAQRIFLGGPTRAPQQPPQLLLPGSGRRYGGLVASLLLHGALLGVIILSGDRLWRRLPEPGAPSLFALGVGGGGGNDVRYITLPPAPRPAAPPVMTRPKAPQPPPTPQPVVAPVTPPPVVPPPDTQAPAVGAVASSQPVPAPGSDPGRVVVREPALARVVGAARFARPSSAIWPFPSTLRPRSSGGRRST
jgi:hypothetical protein